MRRSAVLLCAAVATCSHNESQLSHATDVQQLIESALSADLADARAGRKVCIQRQLEVPLKETIDQWKLTKTVPGGWNAPWSPSDGRLPQRIDVQTEQRLQRAIRDVLAGRSKVARVSVIQSVPPPLILDRSGANQESECEREMPHDLGPPKLNGPEEVTLTRPVFMDGFAFVEYASGCGALCFGSFLKAFEKRNGKWTYIAAAPLAIG